jgi:hypothetical protein
VYGRPILGLRMLPGMLWGRPFNFVQSGGQEPEYPRVPNPRRAALVGLLVTLLLVLGGVLLVHVLGRAAKLQDCVMSGRTNCAPIGSAKTGG